MKIPKTADKDARLKKGYYGVEPVKAVEHGGQGTGGLIAVKKGMQPCKNTPCKECPLRRDSLSGYLGGYTPEMYLQILNSPASVACHMSKGFHEGVIETQHHCVGVIAYRANVGYLPRPGFPESSADADVMRMREGFIPEKERKEVFFSNPNEFLLHHREGQIRKGGAS